MTPLQENILVIAIILANTFIAIGYFAFGFIKTRKKKKAKEVPLEEDIKKLAGEDEEKQEEEREKESIKKEDQGEEPEEEKEEKDDEGQFTKDETERFDSLTKYAILSIFIFLCPVISIVFLGLGTFFYQIFFDRDIDLAAITFSKERVDIVDRPNMEEEMNLVPLEEAIMIDDKDSLRQLLLTVLRGDVSKSINAVSKALNSSDSEASHYAASAIMDVTAEFQNTIQKFQAQLESDPKDREVNQLFIEYLIRMLNAGFLSELELKTYVFLLQHTCENAYQSSKELLKADYYGSLVNLLSRIGELQLAVTWVERFQEDYPDHMEMYYCVLHFYFETKEKEKFFFYMNKLKTSDIAIDKELLELIRIFN
jgi:hypothetical protein